MGLDALAVCRNVRPDVVLMDLHMPGMDGLNAARVLKHQSPATRMVIIASDSHDLCGVPPAKPG
jgi:YesN/AraC family two-component response regulator